MHVVMHILKTLKKEKTGDAILHVVQNDCTWTDEDS